MVSRRGWRCAAHCSSCRCSNASGCWRGAIGRAKSSLKLSSHAAARVALRDGLGMLQLFRTAWPAGTLAARAVWHRRGLRRKAVVPLEAMSFPLTRPFARAAIEEVNPALEQIALLPQQVNESACCLPITLPLAQRGIWRGVLLAFARALGEFGATVMVAGNILVAPTTLPVKIYSLVQNGEDMHGSWRAFPPSSRSSGLWLVKTSTEAQMNPFLRADFSKKFSGGPVIHAEALEISGAGITCCLARPVQAKPPFCAASPGWKFQMLEKSFSAGKRGLRMGKTLCCRKTATSGLCHGIMRCSRMSVAANIAYGLRGRTVAEKSARGRALRLARRMKRTPRLPALPQADNKQPRRPGPCRCTPASCCCSTNRWRHS